MKPHRHHASLPDTLLTPFKLAKISPQLGPFEIQTGVFLGGV
jgi:hypothetical protein